MSDRPQNELERQSTPVARLRSTSRLVCFAVAVVGIVYYSAVWRTCVGFGELGHGDWMTASWNVSFACIAGEHRGRSST